MQWILTPELAALEDLLTAPQVQLLFDSAAIQARFRVTDPVAQLPPLAITLSFPSPSPSPCPRRHRPCPRHHAQPRACMGIDAPVDAPRLPLQPPLHSTRLGHQPEVTTPPGHRSSLGSRLPLGLLLHHSHRPTRMLSPSSAAITAQSTSYALRTASRAGGVYGIMCAPPAPRWPDSHSMLPAPIEPSYRALLVCIGALSTTMGNRVSTLARLICDATYATITELQLPGPLTNPIDPIDPTHPPQPPPVDATSFPQPPPINTTPLPQPSIDPTHLVPSPSPSSTPSLPSLRSFPSSDDDSNDSPNHYARLRVSILDGPCTVHYLGQQWRFPDTS
jgi:hypothetical protein